MPTIEANLTNWNRAYDWNESGEEWSVTWGGSQSQWWGSLFPRLQAYVPCESILEIAPGFGRWTQYLKNCCRRLYVIDLSERCIEHCQRRFAGAPNITYAVNDGKSLDCVPDGSIDLAFSFDSLVHVEADVIETYLNQLARILKPNGVGFIHHSNARSYRTYFRITMLLPRGRRFLSRIGLLNYDHWRAMSMSARLFEQMSLKAGLPCVSQELINWGGAFLIDCISVFARKGSCWERPNRVLKNRRFMQEAGNLRQIAPLYCGWTSQLQP
ncbi:MAG: class I SAM-dependent methyltransferase [Chloroflexi bacterium]|nr:class I SAM-dependent methyltransferase [Chloroflexota bacterium]